MSNYQLYGMKIIEDDSTLKAFAKSVCKEVPIDGLSRNGFKDDFMELVANCLEDDVSRTDIDYEELMYRYRSEIGDLLYEIENNFGEKPEISFFGEDTERCFNNLIRQYIDIHFDELVAPILRAKERNEIENNKKTYIERE